MIEVQVPATSANLGPGFDCAGVAVTLYNKFYIEEIKEGLYIEGCKDEYRNENNLVYISMKKCFEKLGYKPGGLKIKIESEIPESRGLGSSASCIVGGLLAANVITGDKLSKEEILNLASKIEGHPDNVTPALFGGMTVSMWEEDKIVFQKVNVHKGLKFCSLIPNFRLSTKDARSVLPNKVNYKDAVFNIGKVSLMLLSLINGEFDLLKVACKDKIHQPYRNKLIKDYDYIMGLCKKYNSLASFISGAGPTIMVLLEEENKSFVKNIKEDLKNINTQWQVINLNIDSLGAKVKIV